MIGLLKRIHRADHLITVQVASVLLSEGGRVQMARSLGVTDQQARHILAVLISEGKVTERDARLALSRYPKLVKQLRADLRRLEGGDAPFPRQRRTEKTSRRVRRVNRAKPVSAKRRRAMKQQGQYLAAVRPLKAQDRAKVKGTRAEKGFAAAIAEARRLARSVSS